MFDDLTRFKDEVKARVDIVEVIGEYVDLKKRGVTYVAPCPFHHETKPSFTVSRERQFYHCFGCDKGGDVFSFLMDITGMSFVEALRGIAERVGLEMPERTAPDPGAREAAERAAAANLAAAEYFHRTLATDAGTPGMDYLTSRGLTAETIRTFRLGYAPEDPAGLIAFARGKSVSPADLDIAGVIKASKYGGGAPFNRFGGRVIFPIIDQAARVIGFGGRILEGEGAKYVNSPDSPVYRKSRVLYGIYQAWSAIKRARAAVVVEGYMDVISLHQAGIRHAIAASGTAFTVEQGRMIGRLARRTVLLFDGDPAGLRAAARGADNLLGTGLEIGVVVLPEGHDPDSFVREHGADALNRLLDEPMDIWNFKLDVLAGHAEGARDRIALAGEIADSIAAIDDELTREVYIADMSARIGVDIDAMRKAVTGRIRRRRSGTARGESRDTVKTVRRDVRELLAALIQYPKLIGKFTAGTDEGMIDVPVVRRIVDELYHRSVEGLEITPSAMIGGMPEPDTRDLIAAVAMIDLSGEHAEKLVDNWLKHARIRAFRDERAEIGRRMLTVTDAAERSAMLRRQQELYAELKRLGAG